MSVQPFPVIRLKENSKDIVKALADVHTQQTQDILHKFEHFDKNTTKKSHQKHHRFY